MSAIALCVTGCASNGIIGEWTATSLVYNGEVWQLPETYSYTENGVTYTTTYGYKLMVEDDRAAIGLYYEYSSTNGDKESDDAFYSGTWEKGAKGSFDFDFEETAELSLNCVLDKDELSCTSVDGTIDFVRASGDE